MIVVYNQHIMLYDEKFTRVGTIQIQHYYDIACLVFGFIYILQINKKKQKQKQICFNCGTIQLN